MKDVPPDEIVFCTSRWRLLPYLAGSLAFVALGIWISWDADILSAKFVVSTAAAIFFSVTGAVTGVKMLRPPDTITINTDGFFDTRLTRAPLPWPIVERISTTHVHTQKFLVLELRDTDEAAAAILPSARRLQAGNTWMGIHGYTVNMAAMSGSHKELVDTATRFKVASMSGATHAERMTASSGTATD